ncbi:MAG: LysM peptidoglycan-binding domain-containing protein [Cyanobacteria bacterium]|nr:LysM peptidoglycan-binding domain-containing protein [Cyanobacteriota bacterium]
MPIKPQHDLDEELLFNERINQDVLIRGSFEKTPGVYVRSEDYHAKDLDMLWSGARTFYRDERSPFLLLGIGFFAGVLVTTALGCFLMWSPWFVHRAASSLAPVTTSASESQLIQTSGSSQSSGQPELPLPAPVQPVVTQPSTPAFASSGSLVNGSAYEVQNGDTLGSIAYKYYGKSTPEIIQRIQTANHMPSPDTLSLGQKLVLPPAR